MKSYLLETPVLVTFFVRPDKFSQVFGAIKRARPKTLFLIADGPRYNHPDDIPLNDECKKIADDIDWNCNVYKRYSKTNQGIDNNAYSGLKWAFERVDRVIFLEDDIVPSLEFFRFCDDLLEKYLHDHRVFMICGMNHLGVYDEPTADYFFSRAGSIWGFALWKRSFDLLEERLDYVTDGYAMRVLSESCPRYSRKSLLLASREQRSHSIKAGKIVSYELMQAAAFALSNGLYLIPKKNLVSCIGISENSGHSVNHPLKLPKAIRSLFYMKTYTLNTPLVHPKYVIADLHYERRVHRVMGYGSFRRFYRRVEGISRRALFGLYKRSRGSR